MGRKRAGKSSINICQWCQQTFGTNAVRFTEHMNTCQRNHESIQFTRERQKQHNTIHYPDPMQEVCCWPLFLVQNNTERGTFE